MTMAQQIPSGSSIPSEVVQAAATQQLGSPQAVYKPRLSPFTIFSIIFVLLFALLFFVAWYVSSFVQLSAFSDSTSSNAPLFLVGGLLMIGLALLVPLRLFLNRTLGVYVYTNGLIRTEKNTTEVIRWDRVISVERATSRGNSRYTVYRTDGKKFLFTNVLPKVDDLGETIAQGAARYLSPKKRPAQSSSSLESNLAQLGVTLDWQVSDPQTALFGGIAKASLGLAWGQYNSGQLDEAMKSATSVIEDADLQQNPRFVSVLCAARYVRGLVYEKKGDALQASTDFRAALQLSPGYVLAERALERITKQNLTSGP